VWPLRAGPVHLLYSDGDLRKICHGEVEVARRIYVAIRDLDWNTLPGVISNLDITDRNDSFAIRFTRRHTVGTLDYQWCAEIDGSADGTIRYRMRGEARSDFPYAKIGICVHHPIDGYAGHEYRSNTPGGPVTGNLPDAIGPQIHLDDGTDQPLFEPFADLEISHSSGGTVQFEFAGDLWEMEDQRNWTDASYKSTSTPARLGYYHEAHASEQFDQQVVIRTAGFRAPADLGQTSLDFLTITPRAANGRVFPPIGLRCADPGRVPSPAGLAVLRAVAPAHLRADVRLQAESAELEIAAAAERARELNCGLELAVFLPGQDSHGSVEAALDRLNSGLATGQPALARVLAFSDAEESSSAETVTAVRGALSSAGLAAVPVLSGTNIYFNELNRHRVPPGDADGLAWSVNPQIHAYDDLSLMENLQAQPHTIATAQIFAAGTKYYVTPVTLRPRFNAVAVTEQEFPEDGRPRQVDLRQPSLFGAAWTLGSIVALAGAGVDGLTYYDTQGPAGVVESPDGSPNPAEFCSQPDTPFPLAVVLADACGAAGRQIQELEGIDHGRLSGIAIAPAADGADVTVLLANLSSDSIRVRIAAPGAAYLARGRVLDESTFTAATSDLTGFLAARSNFPVAEGAVTVTLHPYATARLDLYGE
jgi:D-apionolactonase